MVAPTKEKQSAEMVNKSSNESDGRKTSLGKPKLGKIDVGISSKLKNLTVKK